MKNLIVVSLLSCALALSACDSQEPKKPDAEKAAHGDEHKEGHGDHEGHTEGEAKKPAEDDGHGHGKEEAGAHAEEGGHGKEDGHAEEGGHGEALKLSPEARKAAGLEVSPAGPGRLVETLLLYGLVKPNAERMRSVTARFPGVVRSVEAKVGDSVAQGQALGSVESNESLQVYNVVSPLAGVVTERFTNPGEQAEAQPLFTVADLSSVWVELSLFPRDRARIKVGQDVRVHTGDDGVSAEGKIVFVSPLGSTPTQSLTARVQLDNRDGRWAPGLHVQGDVMVGSASVALAVPAAALQELEGGLSVFVEDADGLEPRVVKVGRSDEKWVEILEGLKAGERVVGEGSFVLKAQLGKGEASHDH